MIILAFPFLPIGHYDENGLLSEEKMANMDVCYLDGVTLKPGSNLKFNSKLTIIDYDVEGHKYLQKSNVRYGIAMPPADKAEQYVAYVRKFIKDDKQLEKLQSLYNNWNKFIESMPDEDDDNLITVEIGKALEDYITFTDTHADPINNRLQAFVNNRRNTDE